MTALLSDIENRGVTVVIGSYNRKRFLKKTIETVRNELDSCPFSYEIIIVDGGSTDGTLSWLIKQKDIITIVQHNRGEWRGKSIERRSWGYFMNLGFKIAKGKYVCMLSDDCLVVPGAVRNGYELFEERLSAGEKIGAVAFYWRNWPDMEKYWVGKTYANKLFVNHGMYLNNCLKEIDYIDEKGYHFYHADGDLCLKLWLAGYSVLESPKSFIEHYTHVNTLVRSMNLEKQKEDFFVYQNRWGINSPFNDCSEGGWVEKVFEDHFFTAKKYWLYIYFKHALLLKWNLLKRSIRKMIKDIL